MNLSLIRVKYHSVWEPLNLLYLAAYVRRNVPLISIKILDGYFEPDNVLLSEASQSDVVGISASTPQLPDALDLAKKIKQMSPDTKIVVGGYGPSYQPRRCVKPYVDHVVIGEGEEALRRIIVGEEHKHFVSLEPIKNINSIPFPARDLVDLEKYIQIAVNDEGRRVTSLLSARGCPANCRFCLPGQTKVLMADLRWVNIEDVHKGEHIVGVEKHGDTGRFHYVEGEVRETFSRTATVHAIETLDGTVYSTKDHPWLMASRWRSIEDVEHGMKYNASFISHRAVLNKVSSPTSIMTETEDYMRGYLSGSLEGDGCLRSAKCTKNGKNYYYDRMSIVGDYEMLDRFYEYGTRLGLVLRRRKFNGGKFYRCDRGVFIDSHHECQKLKATLACEETDEYVRGFLSGIYDAEGSYSSSAIRISNRDQELITKISRYLSRFNFSHRIEKMGLLLHGGMKEQIRFLSFCLPCVAHKKRALFGKQLYGASKIARTYPLGERKVYNLETTTSNFIADGFVTHNCAEGYGRAWNRAVYDRGNFVRVGPKSVRLRRPLLVVEEMLQIRDIYRLDFIKFSDAETNPTKNHFVDLCKEIVSQRLDTPWGCNMRVDKVDEEVAKWAEKAGCTEWWIGVESGSDEILRHLNKGITVDQTRNTFRLAKKHGIKTRANLFLGSDLESYDTIKETETLLDEISPDLVAIAILMPYPGTAYYPIFVKEHPEVNWAKMDNYGNPYRRSQYMSNVELRGEQVRLLEKYGERLPPIVDKKMLEGIIK